MHHNQHIAELGPLFERLGIRHIVICPGSRNAPLTQLFTSQPAFTSYSIVDERSAGYVALGMARQLGEPVGVVTTSGTAVLNLGPAVAEAFHQRVPLVVLTADRALEEIPQFNNQWVDQEAPFFAFSKGFYQLPAEVPHPEDMERMLAHVQRVVGAAITFPAGPVHINVPLDEPLYERLPVPVFQPGSKGIPVEWDGEEEVLPPVAPDRKILVLAGMGSPDETLRISLSRLVHTRQAVVVAENISNLPGEEFVATPDLLLALADEQERKELLPDLVISFGGQVVSKRLKLFLKSGENLEYHEIGGNVASAIENLAGEHPAGNDLTNDYHHHWKKVQERVFDVAAKRLEELPFGNLYAIHRILSAVPGGTTIHLGNSAVIRYSQMVPCRGNLTFYSNRGVSGIDGCVSAAVGAASVSINMHLLLVGDLSFVYDSNALWNKSFPGNLRIVVLNDGGGGIFRLLEGPDRMDFFEEFSVTHHPVSLELLSQAYGRVFQRAGSRAEFEEKLEMLFYPGTVPQVLEVDTSDCENSLIFKDFLDTNH
jgi:2-succinyl-5-enolpyruvyl-6-hydroxy-3-cyclohexene-1-carboxylate synthase